MHQLQKTKYQTLPLFNLKQLEQMDSLEHEGQGYDIFWKGMRCPVPYCNYAGNFNYFSKLKLHQKNVHLSIVTLHMCPNCAKSFKKGKQELKRHMIKVHQTPKEMLTK